MDDGFIEIYKVLNPQKENEGKCVRKVGQLKTQQGRRNIYFAPLYNVMDIVAETIDRE